MVSRIRTGADRYFARRASEPGYAEAYNEARRRIDAIDRLVRALDDRREELGLSTANVLMIGDTTHDLGMARAAGSQAVAVTYGAHSREELTGEPALAVVDTVPELRRVLLDWIR